MIVCSGALASNHHGEGLGVLLRVESDYLKTKNARRARSGPSRRSPVSRAIRQK